MTNLFELPSEMVFGILSYALFSIYISTGREVRHAISNPQTNGLPIPRKVSREPLIGRYSHEWVLTEDSIHLSQTHSRCDIPKANQQLILPPSNHNTSHSPKLTEKQAILRSNATPDRSSLPSLLPLI
jgi:hypothetical protein